MKVQEILRNLDLGNSVAEFDEALENYFLETETFHSLTRGQVDIIAGDKGTGKTAIYRILQRRYRKIAELNEVEVVTGFNPTGNPIFKTMTENISLNEGQYISVWKAYILSLIGNWILQIYEDGLNDNMRKLDRILKSLDLRTSDDTPNTVFAGLMNVVRRITNPQSAEFSTSFDQQGMPTFSQKVEFDEVIMDTEKGIIRHEQALNLLNKVLSDAGFYVWVVLDRLDEAFQGFPNVEVPALRALLRTYLDLGEFDHIKLKLFVRKDLFRKVTYGGFVNLTHINARKREIVWDDEDLFELLFRRIRTSSTFLDHLNAHEKSSGDLFNLVFPDQVDSGTRRPKTWTWMLSRIRDGNSVKSPRNLIDIIKKAQESQLRREDREDRDYNSGIVIIEPESIRRAHTALSIERVNDTLLAESGEYALVIDKFRDGKSEHNEISISRTIGEPISRAREIIKVLLDIGFLEQIGSSYKIPSIYRDGLNITQGKAF